ncbi:MAG: hypothetical protein JWN44_1179 [Myxococcales bacterium]|nr:hypothetical protein [Myxococcales bacterium]
MLKMYGRTAHGSGESPAQWEQAWGTFDHAAWLRDAARISHNDPISRWVEPAVERGGLFLEGGCGLGHWVKWLHHRGHRAVGIDFAPALVASTHKLDPALRMLAGDVRALPLADGCVQTYLSNGVVEHWEDGPDAGLHEARRVIAKDGVFLCTVPDASWLRGFLYRRDMMIRGSLAARHVERADVEDAPEGWTFYQYAFAVDEFTRRLQAAGFDVVETAGQSLIYGLFEIPGVQRAYDAAYQLARKVLRRERISVEQNASASTNDAAPQAAAATESFEVEPRSTLLERALFREEPAIPVVGPLITRAAERCSTMRMYVARPR